MNLKQEFQPIIIQCRISKAVENKLLKVVKKEKSNKSIILRDALNQKLNQYEW